MQHYSHSPPVERATQSTSNPHLSVQTTARRIAFCLQDRACAEAICLVLESRGLPVVSFEYAHATQIWKHEPPDVGLFVFDPVLCTTGKSDLLANLQARKTPLVFLGSDLKTSNIDLAIRYKARGILTSRMSLSQLIEKIQQLQAGLLAEYWCPEAEQLIDRSGSQKRLKEGSLYTQLTPRQLEVLAHLAEGKTVKEVAQMMHLSQKSVDSHKYRIMNRLHIHDRVHLSRLAIREGLIEP